MAELTVIEGTLPPEVPRHAVSLQPSEITGLIGLFQTMLDRTERNILERLDENSRGATERWAKHDAELAENTRRVVARFEAIEGAVREHHQLAHEAQIRSDARIRPLRYSVAWLWTQRRDIVILLIGIGVLSTFILDFITHIGGAPT